MSTAEEYEAAVQIERDVWEKTLSVQGSAIAAEVDLRKTKMLQTWQNARATAEKDYKALLLQIDKAKAHDLAHLEKKEKSEREKLTTYQQDLRVILGNEAGKRAFAAKGKKVVKDKKNQESAWVSSLSEDAQKRMFAEVDECSRKQGNSPQACVLTSGVLLCKAQDLPILFGAPFIDRYIPIELLLELRPSNLSGEAPKSSSSSSSSASSSGDGTEAGLEFVLPIDPDAANGTDTIPLHQLPAGTLLLKKSAGNAQSTIGVVLGGGGEGAEYDGLGQALYLEHEFLKLKCMVSGSDPQEGIDRFIGQCNVELQRLTGSLQTELDAILNAPGGGAVEGQLDGKEMQVKVDKLKKGLRRMEGWHTAPGDFQVEVNVICRSTANRHTSPVQPCSHTQILPLKPILSLKTCPTPPCTKCCMH
jgi:hypothetical protein